MTDSQPEGNLNQDLSLPPAAGVPILSREQSMVRTAAKRVQEVEMENAALRQQASHLAGLIAALVATVLELKEVADPNAALIIAQEKLDEVNGRTIHVLPQEGGGLAVSTFDPEEAENLAELRKLAETVDTEPEA